MPPVKELHFFDRNPSYPSPSHLWSDSILKRLVGSEKHNKRFRKRFAKEMLKELVYMKPSNIPWKCKYLLNTCSIEWCKSLFNDKESKIKGEITPGYSILKSKDI